LAVRYDKDTGSAHWFTRDTSGIEVSDATKNLLAKDAGGLEKLYDNRGKKNFTKTLKSKYKIVDETELLKYPENRVKEQQETLTADYEAMAETYGYSEWDEFRDAYFQMDQAEFEEQLRLYAESLVKSEMVIYAVAEKEGIVLTEEAYEQELQNMLDMAGFESDADFQDYAGMSIREYADSYDMDRDILLTKWLEAVYDRLEKE